MQKPSTNFSVWVLMEQNRFLPQSNIVSELTQELLNSIYIEMITPKLIITLNPIAGR